MSPRGGAGKGQGRPTGSIDPMARRVQLTQRYRDDEVEQITHAAGGKSHVGGFIRDAALYRVRCPHLEFRRTDEWREFTGGMYRLHVCIACGTPDWRDE